MEKQKDLMKRLLAESRAREIEKYKKLGDIHSPIYRPTPPLKLVNKPERVGPPATPPDFRPRHTENFCTQCGRSYELKCLPCLREYERSLIFQREKREQARRKKIRKYHAETREERVAQDIRNEKARKKRIRDFNLCVICEAPKQHVNWKICDSSSCEMELKRRARKNSSQKI